MAELSAKPVNSLAAAGLCDILGPKIDGFDYKKYDSLWQTLDEKFSH